MSVLDLLVIMVWLFVFAICIFVGFEIMNTLTGDADMEAAIDDPQSWAHMDNTFGLVKALDGIFVFVVFMLFLAVILSAFYIKTHPAFFIISIVLLLIIITISASFSNAFGDFVNSTSTTTGVPMDTQYPGIYAIFSNLPTILFIFSIILIIVMYGKTQSG